MPEQTINDTGIHPRPGWIVAEHIKLDNGKLIQIPEHLRKNGEDSPETHDDFKIVVLEDGDGVIAPGTKVLTTGRTGFNHRGRKLLLLQKDSIIATMD